SVMPQLWLISKQSCLVAHLFHIGSRRRLEESSIFARSGPASRLNAMTRVRRHAWTRVIVFAGPKTGPAATASGPGRRKGSAARGGGDFGGEIAVLTLDPLAQGEADEAGHRHRLAQFSAGILDRLFD